jgi:para-nitrobenzyl esterase
MPDRPGVLLSLRTASNGGNALSTSVGWEHLCDLWNGEASR